MPILPANCSPPIVTTAVTAEIANAASNCSGGSLNPAHTANNMAKPVVAKNIALKLNCVAGAAAGSIGRSGAISSVGRLSSLMIASGNEAGPVASGQR